MLLGREPAVGRLWFVVRTGLAAEFLPELAALALEQDPVHRHKDVLAHTVAVVEQTTALDGTRLTWGSHGAAAARHRQAEDAPGRTG